MFRLFLVLLSFSETLASETKVSDRRKSLFLNNELCMVRPTLIDMNPVGLKYYSFLISLNKCTGSCNVLSHLTVSANSIVHHTIQNKNEITKHVKASVEIIASAKKIIIGILAHVFVRIVSI